MNLPLGVLRATNATRPSEWGLKRMGFRLIPRKENFFDMLKEQLGVLEEATATLLEIYYAKYSNPLWSKDISASERKGDLAADKLIDKVRTTTFGVPFDHEDWIKLADAVDDVLDRTEDAVKKIVKYAIVGDETLNPIVLYCIDSIRQVCRGALCLREKNYGRLDEAIKEIIKLRNDVDEAADGVIGRGYEMDVITVLARERKGIVSEEEMQRLFDTYHGRRKCREIAEVLKAVIIACREVSKVLGGIRVKNP